MDPSRFDSLVRNLVVRPSRRRVLAAVAAALALPAATHAQGGGGVVVCHRGTKTLKVKARELETHLAHGDTEGPCADTQLPAACDPPCKDRQFPTCDGGTCCNHELVFNECDFPKPNKTAVTRICHRTCVDGTDEEVLFEVPDCPNSQLQSCPGGTRDCPSDMECVDYGDCCGKICVPQCGSPKA